MVHDPLIGRKLGDYTIQRLLGRGGMSRVYVGYDENLDRYAAVKVISGEASTMDEAEYARRFQAEARAIARLRHPNIVGIYQFGRSRGVYYMAQVLLEGADLRTLLRAYAERNQRMPAAEIVRVVRDIADALDYAHEQGVIHRDVKPSNIMLERRTGRAILMDFGLALSVPEGTLGDTFGSAHYIAPEQAISSAKAVPQSDLYSLGVVVYEMVAGTVPFDDPSVMNVALKHLNEPPPPPSLHNPDLPAAVEQVILRALEKDPTRRFRTGAAFADALARAFADAPARLNDGPSIAELMRWRATSPEQPSAPPTTPPPSPSAPSRPRHTPLPVPEGSLSGVAARFAQHRQEKEAEEALQSIADGDLLLDDLALEDLLESYSQPYQPAATQQDRVASPPVPADERGRSPDSGAAMASGRKRMRLALLVVILLAALGGAVLVSRQEEDRGSAVGALETMATATSPAPTATSTPVSTETRQPASSVTPSRLLTVSPVAGVALATATRTSTAVPSPTLTVTASPMETPTPTATASPTPSPTATLLPSATAGPPPTLRLIFTPDSLLLLNVSGAALDVSGLIFEQVRDGEPARVFRATAWERQGIVDPPDSMRSGGCYQVVTQNATQTQPDRSVCPEFLGYVRLDSVRRYFWDAATPDAVFVVRLADKSAPLGLCAVSGGECGIYLEAPAATPTPTPSSTPTRTPTPTATPTPVPDIRLLYNGDAILVINISATTLNISDLVFEQTLPDGRILSFEATLWNRPDMVLPPAQMPPGGCYQAVTGEGTQIAPDRAVCGRFLGWFRTSAPSRYFWLSSDPEAVFTVHRVGQSVSLATCVIAAGECSFSLAGGQ